ncbi:MAG: alkaline phosphatase family protein [Desulfurococcales archaeon]|nr:alkaline phosphatase family protein [Desulfurococcales archaeon]
MKTIIIGLDGARLDVLTKWAGEGRLPTVARILREGVHGRLESVLPIHSFPAWTSLSTGVYPPKHGIYDVLLMDERGFRLLPPNSTMVRVRRFWEILDELGYRCLVVNVPVTYPPRPLKRGAIVSSVLTPSTDHVFAYPRDVWERLRRQGYKILPKSRPGTRGYVEEAHEILDKQYSFVEWYTENRDWDLLFWVVMSTEMLHHHYAPFIDPEHPLYRPEYEDIVRSLYEKVDKYIGELLEGLGRDYTVFIVSDHGFAPYYGVLYLNAVLERHGLLATRSRLLAAKRLFYSVAKEVGKRVYGYLPKSLKEKALKASGFGAHEFTLGLIDWARTRAYVAFLDGHVNVNLKGREAGGSVDPGSYREVVGEVLEKLGGDPELPTALRLIPKWEVYREGPYIDKVPDVFVLFGESNERPFKVKTNPFARRIVEPRLAQFRENTGYHTLYGVFMAYGSNIRQGYERDARIVDLAPTILAIHGVKPPSYMDGRVISDIFEEEPRPGLSYDSLMSLKKRLRSLFREGKGKA